MSDIVEIKKLTKNDTHEIQEVAKIFYNWWGKDSNLTKNDLMQIVINRCENLIPATYIAKMNNQVVGTITFIDNDTELRKDLYPMLGGMYVLEEYRHQGIASKLINNLIDDVSNNFDCIYLTTPLENFYEQFGFKFIEITDVNMRNGKPTRERLYKIEF